MIFVREIHFSTLVQNFCGSTSVQKDPQSAHHIGVWVTGGRCRWCDILQMLLLLPRCPVIRVTGSVRYTKYFYRSTLFSGRICYGPVSICLFVTSRSPALTVVCKATRVYMPILGGVVWTFYHLLCKNGWTDLRQSLKPTPIHAKCDFKLKDRLPSKELRERLGIDDIALVLQQNRLHWYGHVLRKDDDDWVKKCMEYEVEGPRPRGRPKWTWREVVREDCQACKLNKEDAMDRCKWRKMIKDVRWSGWVWVGECFFWYRPTRTKGR